jgi:hypothetical protein
MDLAQLWKSQGHHEKALSILLSVYGQFTEGFASHDLAAARALIGQLQMALH